MPFQTTPKNGWPMKKHKCRYRMDRKRSIAGLVHCWFWGSCTSRDCPNRIEQKYIEIKDNTVHYSYDVGVTNQNCTTPFSTDWLCAITRILELSSRAWERTIEVRKQNLWTEKLSERGGE